MIFPIEILRIIYQYDSTYHEIFNKSLTLIKNNHSLPFWGIHWQVVQYNSIITSSGSGKYYMDYYEASENSACLNKDNMYFESVISHKPLFIGDGI
jgi:hypothetical protein